MSNTTPTETTRIDTLRGFALAVIEREYGLPFPAFITADVVTQLRDTLNSKCEDDIEAINAAVEAIFAVSAGVR